LIVFDFLLGSNNSIYGVHFISLEELVVSILSVPLIASCLITKILLGFPRQS